YFNYWNHYYQAIRSATNFIENAGNNPEILRLPNGQDLMRQYLAEARTLRAYFYFSLIRQYGPVILLSGDKTIPVDAVMEDILLPRSSFDACVSYIESELDMAYADLPEWYNQGLMNDG